jgi:hypothetical protein
VLAIPTEVGQEFADAVNVMLVDALAPSQRSRRRPTEESAAQSSRPSGPDPISVDAQRPTRAPAPIEVGLAALAYHQGWHAGNAPLGSIPTQILWYSQNWPPPATSDPTAT